MSSSLMCLKRFFRKHQISGYVEFSKKKKTFLKYSKVDQMSPEIYSKTLQYSKIFKKMRIIPKETKKL